MLQGNPFWAQDENHAQPVSSVFGHTWFPLLLTEQQHGVDHTSPRCCHG